MALCYLIDRSIGHPAAPAAYQALEQLAAQLDAAAPNLDVLLAQAERAYQADRGWGLVATLPHRGACVAVYTDEDVEEIYSLRTALEALAIERTIARATPGDVRSLEQLIDDMGQLANPGDFDAILRVDMAFHRRICAVASHRRLLEAWESLARQIQAIYTVTDLPKLVQQLYGYMANISDRHRPIVDAIRTGDVQFGRQHMTTHILEVAKILAAQRAAATRAKDGVPAPLAR